MAYFLPNSFNNHLHSLTHRGDVGIHIRFRIIIITKHLLNMQYSYGEITSKKDFSFKYKSKQDHQIPGIPVSRNKRCQERYTFPCFFACNLASIDYQGGEGQLGREPL